MKKTWFISNCWFIWIILLTKYSYQTNEVIILYTKHHLCHIFCPTVAWKVEQLFLCLLVANIHHWWAGKGAAHLQGQWLHQWWAEDLHWWGEQEDVPGEAQERCGGMSVNLSVIHCYWGLKKEPFTSSTLILLSSWPSSSSWTTVCW